MKIRHHRDGKKLSLPVDECVIDRIAFRADPEQRYQRFGIAAFEYLAAFCKNGRAHSEAAEGDGCLFFDLTCRKDELFGTPPVLDEVPLSWVVRWKHGSLGYHC